jgi:hypothetical protein
MERIPLNEDNRVVVRAAGDVCIRGWGQVDMQALCDRGGLVQTQQQNGIVYVVSKSDLCLSVPVGVPVRIEHISGDAFITGLVGRLEVQKVGGDLAVERCGEVNIGVTGGDLLLREISQAVVIQKVSGDLNGEALVGGLIVEEVGGDASFQTGKGTLHLRAGGDLKLYLPGQEGEEVSLRAGGDIKIFCDKGINAQLELSSGGQEIDIDINNRSSHVEQATYTTVLGEGGRLIRARAGGDICVSDEDWDEDDLADEFEDQIKNWEGWRGEIDGKKDEPSDIEGKIRRRTEESVRRAEERVNDAMKRVERQNQRHQDIFSRFGIRWGNFWPNASPITKDNPGVNVIIPPIQIPKFDVEIPEINIPDMEGNFNIRPVQVEGQIDTAMSDTGSEETIGVSNEERMQVLKMLREHKITVDEADELLRALSGDAG